MRQTASRSDLIHPRFRSGGYRENSIGLEHLDPVSLVLAFFYFICLNKFSVAVMNPFWQGII